MKNRPQVFSCRETQRDSVFYMTFLGPLAFIQPDGTVIANIGWAEAQGAWTAFLSAQS